MDQADVYLTFVATDSVQPPPRSRDEMPRKSPEASPQSHSPNYTYIKKKAVSHVDLPPLDTLENDEAAAVGIRLRDRSEVHDDLPIQASVGPIYGFLRHKSMKETPAEPTEAGTPDGFDPAPPQESAMSSTAADGVPDNNALDRMEYAGTQQGEPQEAPGLSVQPNESHTDAPPAFEPQYAFIHNKKSDLAPTAGSDSPHLRLGARSYPPGYTFLEKKDNQHMPPAAAAEVGSVDGVAWAPPLDSDVSPIVADHPQASGNYMLSDEALHNSSYGTVDGIRSCRTTLIRDPEPSPVTSQDGPLNNRSQPLSASLEDLQLSSAAPDSQDDDATTVDRAIPFLSVACDEVFQPSVLHRCVLYQFLSIVTFRMTWHCCPLFTPYYSNMWISVLSW